MRIVFGKYRKDHKPRTERVRIDDWDTWSAFTDLALIIEPLLRKFRKDTHGGPFIDNEDVPPHLQQTSDPGAHNVDDNWHRRWDWVLDEMIWTFYAIAHEEEFNFWTEQPEIDFSEHDEDKGKKARPLRWKKPGVLDRDAQNAHEARINNGLRLFGKYFRSLWT